MGAMLNATAAAMISRARKPPLRSGRVLASGPSLPSLSFTKLCPPSLPAEAQTTASATLGGVNSSLNASSG